MIPNCTALPLPILNSQAHSLLTVSSTNPYVSAFPGVLCRLRTTPSPSDRLSPPPNIGWSTCVRSAASSAQFWVTARSICTATKSRRRQKGPRGRMSRCTFSTTPRGSVLLGEYQLPRERLKGSLDHTGSSCPLPPVWSARLSQRGVGEAPTGSADPESPRKSPLDQPC